MNHENEEGVDKFRIKWKGWGRQHNSWEPLENLDDGASELAMSKL